MLNTAAHLHHVLLRSRFVVGGNGAQELVGAAAAGGRLAGTEGRRLNPSLKAYQ